MPDPQSTFVVKHLKEKQIGTSFTSPELVKEVQSKYPGITNGAISGLIYSLWHSGYLERNITPNSRAATFTLLKDLDAYNNKAQSSKDKPQTSTAPKIATDKAKTKPAKNTKISQVVNGRQRLVPKDELPTNVAKTICEAVRILSKISPKSIDLTSVPTEVLIKELLKRETSR